MKTRSRVIHSSGPRHVGVLVASPPTRPHLHHPPARGGGPACAAPPRARRRETFFSAEKICSPKVPPPKLLSFRFFRLVDALTQLRRRESVVTAVEVDSDGQIPAGIELVFVFKSENPHIDAERVFGKHLREVGFGVVGHYFVYVFDAAEDYHPLFERHDGLVLLAGAVDGRV